MPPHPFPRHAARFLTSAAAPAQWPQDEGAEVVFIGRSNAGKSTVLNALCAIVGLARVSRSPGRTRLFNFFALDDAATRRLVDVPGYGFARAATAERRRWRLNLEHYLAQRQSLRGVVLIMDARRPLQDSDWQLLGSAHTTAHPVHILLNKADKLSRGAAARSLREAQQLLQGGGKASPAPDPEAAVADARRGGDGAAVISPASGSEACADGGATTACPTAPAPSAPPLPPLSLQLSSALKGDGIDDARELIAAWLAGDG